MYYQNIYDFKNIDSGHSKDIIFFRNLGSNTNLVNAGIASIRDDYPVKSVELKFVGSSSENFKEFLEHSIFKLSIQSEKDKVFSNLYSFQESTYEIEAKTTSIIKLPINEYIKAGHSFFSSLKMNKPLKEKFYVKTLIVYGSVVKNKSCSCNMRILMSLGCQCGGT